jgi:hypothetical protein
MRSFLTLILAMLVLLTASAISAVAECGRSRHAAHPRRQTESVGKAPRARDGKPDLSGTWRAEPIRKEKRKGWKTRYFHATSSTLPADSRESVRSRRSRAAPWTFSSSGWAAEGKEDPQTRCVPPGTASGEHVSAAVEDHPDAAGDRDPL